MASISFAPNCEDAIASRALGDVVDGTYVDVGVCDPDRDSVTRALYERGWRGLNVAGTPRALDLLRQFRPGDVNLDPTARPDDIWDSRGAREIHVLNIGAACDGRHILESLDLRHRRPWIVVLSHGAEGPGDAGGASVRDLLRVAGYGLARAEGATRFFVASERAGVFDALAAGDAPAAETVAEHAPATAEEIRSLRKQRDRLLEIVTSGARAFDARNHGHLSPYLDRPLPTLTDPKSQLCTQSQLDEPLYRRWCSFLRQDPSAHRKQWEFVYIMQALWSRGLLRPGARALGFGCGNEPLAAAIAAYGCEVVATDLDPDDDRSKDWRATDQHVAGKVEALNVQGICRPEAFGSLVRYRNVDMNHVPDDLRGFDFVWSSCALEHIGSIRHGLDFIHNAMKCLKPGGWAVHTTEFNLSSNDGTVESPSLSYLRAFDFEKVAAELTMQGHDVEPFNFNPGDALLDRYVDVPPFDVSAIHLRLRSLDHTITSVGILVRKGRPVEADRERAPDDPESAAFAEALEPHIAGMEADPHDVANFLEIARLLDAAGDFSGTRRCLEIGLDQNPDNHALWQALVEWSARRNDAAAAAADAREALARLPLGGYGDWHLRVAGACLARGALQDARDVLDQGTSLFPEHARLRELRSALPLSVTMGFLQTTSAR